MGPYSHDNAGCGRQFAAQDRWHGQHGGVFRDARPERDVFPVPWELCAICKDNCRSSGRRRHRRPPVRNGLPKDKQQGNDYPCRGVGGLDKSLCNFQGAFLANDIMASRKYKYASRTTYTRLRSFLSSIIKCFINGRYRKRLMCLRCNVI